MLAVDWTNIILDLIQTTAIIAGGLYTLREYRLFRRFSPKIQFDVDFDLYPIKDISGNYLLNIKLIIENKGNVRKKFPKIRVGVKTFSSEDIEKALNTQKRLKGQNELIPKHNIVPEWVQERQAKQVQ